MKIYNFVDYNKSYWQKVIILLLIILGWGILLAGDNFSAVLLDYDFGDPQQPNNAKVVLDVTKNKLNLFEKISAENIKIYIFPEELTEQEGKIDRYAAQGLYVWQYNNKLFVDIRELPKQDKAGRVKIYVKLSLDNNIVIDGLLEAKGKYTAKKIDVVLAVDVSKSMRYNDPYKTRVKAVKAFIEMAKQSSNINSIGLITFNQQASFRTSLLPIEKADEIVRILIKQKDDGLTNLDAPINLAKMLLKNNDSQRGAIILLTDGKNEGSYYQGAHQTLIEDNVKLFTVGLSSEADHGLLEIIAEEANGLYFRADRDKDLQLIYEKLALEIENKHLIYAQEIKSSEGNINFSVDENVKKITIISDATKTIELINSEKKYVLEDNASTEHARISINNPLVNEWQLVWQRASVTGLKSLAIFAETDLFIDLFPIQIDNDKAIVTATLANKKNPIINAAVEVSLVIAGERYLVKLFDDGEHNDVLSNDGIYSGIIEINEKFPQVTAVNIRANGLTNEQNKFTRQINGYIKTNYIKNKAKVAKLLGYKNILDLGQLYPGEEASAKTSVRLDVEIEKLKDLFLDFQLSEFKNKNFENKNVASWRCLINTDNNLKVGDNNLALDLVVPRDIAPGEYIASLEVKAEKEKIFIPVIFKVVAAELTLHKEIDFGVVRPNEVLSLNEQVYCQLPKQTSKIYWKTDSSSLHIYEGNNNLFAGESSLPFTLQLNVPADSEFKEYHANIEVAVESAIINIPVKWEVKDLNTISANNMLSVNPEDFKLSLPSNSDNKNTFNFDNSFTLISNENLSDIFNREDEKQENKKSLWEEIEKKFITNLPEVNSVNNDIVKKNDATKNKAGNAVKSFWNYYLLLTLLLLGLFLGLIIYLVYRLSKKRFVRLLVASLCVNVFLLVAFMVLLQSKYLTASENTENFSAIIGEIVSESSSEYGDELNYTYEKEPLKILQNFLELKEINTPISSENLEVSYQVNSKEIQIVDNKIKNPLVSKVDRKEYNYQESSVRSKPISSISLDKDFIPEVESDNSYIAHSNINSKEISITKNNSKEGKNTFELTYEKPNLLDNYKKEVQVIKSKLSSLDSKVDISSEPWNNNKNTQEFVSYKPKGIAQVFNDIPEEKNLAELTTNIKNNLPFNNLLENNRFVDQVSAQKLTYKTEKELPKAYLTKEKILEPGQQETIKFTNDIGVNRQESIVNSKKKLLRNKKEKYFSLAQFPSVEVDKGSLNFDEKKWEKHNVVNKKNKNEVLEISLNDINSLQDKTNNLRTKSEYVSAEKEKNYISKVNLVTHKNNLKVVQSNNVEINAKLEKQEKIKFAKSYEQNAVDNSLINILEVLPKQKERTKEKIGVKKGGKIKEKDLAWAEKNTSLTSTANNRQGSFQKLVDNNIKLETTSVSLQINHSKPVQEYLPLTRHVHKRKNIKTSFTESSINTEKIQLRVGYYLENKNISDINSLLKECAKVMPKDVVLEQYELEIIDNSLDDCLMLYLNLEEFLMLGDKETSKLKSYLSNDGALWLDGAKENASELKKSIANKLNLSASEFIDNKEKIISEKVALIYNKNSLLVTNGLAIKKSTLADINRNIKRLEDVHNVLNYFLTGEESNTVEFVDLKKSGLAKDDIKISDIPDSLVVENIVHVQKKVWEDFSNYDPDKWGATKWANPLALSVISDKQGGKALKIDLLPGDKQKWVLQRNMEKFLDLSTCKYLEMGVYTKNLEAAILSIVITVADENNKWVPYQSKGINLAEGWQKVNFNVAGESFKNINTGWNKYDGKIQNISKVGRLELLIEYNNRKDSYFIIDNITIIE